jgi:hypothetical protein
MVTGQYSVIAYTEFNRTNDLNQLINKIRSIDGVIRTNTAIAIPNRLQ